MTKLAKLLGAFALSSSLLVACSSSNSSTTKEETAAAIPPVNTVTTKAIKTRPTILAVDGRR